MTFVANVNGGTGAGRKRVKTLGPWECDCREFDPKWHKDGHSLGRNRVHAGHRYSCADCGARRP